MSKKNKIQNIQRTMMSQSVTFSGPIPPPDILEKYDSILPGAAKILIEMAKSQSEHRQNIEKDVILSDIKNSRLGLYFGFIIGMTGIIGGAVIIIFSAHARAGSFLSLISLGSLVGTFVYGSQGRKKEREAKRE